VVTAVATATNEKEVAAAEKEAVPNDMSSMIMQATELVTVEADDGNDATAALGDMEITLRAMKPSPVVTTPSQQTDMHGRDGSNAVVQTPTRDYMDVDSSPTDAGVVEQGELKTDESEKMAAAPGGGQEEEPKAESSSSEKNILPAQRSPTSQFELDVLNATHPTVDFENLQKCSKALLDDDDDKSISSEESQGSDDISILSDAASVNAKVQKDDEVLDFVHDILSPMDCAADFMFCQMQCAFPNIVEDANEIMTTNLHHLMFCGEGEEEEAKEEGGGAVVVESDGAGDDNRGEGDNDQGGEDEEDVVVVFGTSLDEQGEGGAGQDDETADEQEEDEGGEEIVVDEQQDSLEVDVVLGRWVKMQEDQLGDSDNNPSYYKIMKTRGRLVRVNTTSCEKRYAPHAVAGKIEGGKDTSYYGRVINDKAIDYNVFHSFNDDKEEFAEDLAYLHDLRQIGKIEPKLFSQVGFDELGEGWEKLMAEGGNGVVVLSPWKLGFTTVHG